MYAHEQNVAPGDPNEASRLYYELQYRKVLHHLRIQRYATDVSEIRKRSFARLTGTVGSANSHQSTATGVSAALIQYEVGQQHRITEPFGFNHNQVYSFGTVALWDELVIACKGGTLTIPPGTPARFYFKDRGAVDVSTLEHGLPEHVADLAARHHSGELAYFEQVLRQGDTVEVWGYVEPFASPDASRQHAGFRGAGRFDAVRATAEEDWRLVVYSGW